MAEEELTIDYCPICRKSHTYKLEVNRSLFMKMITATEIHEKPKARRFTRLFNCPETSRRFEARFILYESSDDKIKSINIKNT